MDNPVRHTDVTRRSLNAAAIILSDNAPFPPPLATRGQSYPALPAGGGVFVFIGAHGAPVTRSNVLHGRFLRWLSNRDVRPRAPIIFPCR